MFQHGRWRQTPAAYSLLIEKKGAGVSLIQDLHHENIYAIGIDPDGDKILRMEAQTARIEAGAVYLPRNAPWLDEFKKEVLSFPKGRHDAAPARRTLYAQHGELHLAYQVVGNGPIDILLVPGFVSHVERIWEEPRSRAVLTALSKMGRLILFDRRGVGLSDRVGAPPTVEATADDLMTVMDAAGSRRVLLIGISEGGPSCIRFAAKHPQRLAGLVLYGSLAKGARSRDYPFVLTRAQYDRWLQKLVKDWGGPTGIETFAPSLVGDRQAEGWWSGLLRAASSPGAIKAVLEALRDTDVRTQLPLVHAPTLVLHRRDDRAVRIEAGRHLATSIPGARFVELDGSDHWLWAGDQVVALQHIRRFADRLHQ
jgi:pimeloyl-ACP methyl ester carboxylesterase